MSSLQVRSRWFRRVGTLVVTVLVASTMVAGLAAPSGAQASRPFELFDGDAAADDEVNTYLLSALSHYVYADTMAAYVLENHPGSIGDTFAAQAELVTAEWGLGGFTSLSAPGVPVDAFTLDTEGFVVETDDAVILAFRGTELSNPGSALFDIAVDASSLLSTLGGVGLGFNTAADLVMPAVRGAVDAADGKDVWITGHSLGGAIAQAVALKLESPPLLSGLAPVEVAGVVTFGQPQTFTSEAVCTLGLACAHSTFETLIGDAGQRWVNNDDPVPTVLGVLEQTGDALAALAGDPGGLVGLVFGYVFVGETRHIQVEADGSCSIDSDAPAVGIDLTLGDHDTGRYASRIFTEHLSSSQQESLLRTVPSLPPPEPQDEVADCDEFEFPDLTPPDITPTVVGTLGTGGWYTSDVEVSWSVVDDESSASVVINGCETAEVGSDTGGVTFTCEATSDGGSSSAAVTVKRDATAPQASAEASRAPNAAGWYNAPFEVAWSGSDLTSGISGCDPSVTYSGPDAITGLTGTCTDNAGNQSTPAAYSFAYDATAPTIEIASPLEGADYLQNQIVSASYSCGDELSGFVSCSGTVADTEAIETSIFGVHPFTVAAADAAGNLASLTNSYSVTFSLGGGFLPPAADEGTSVRAGSTLPVKWVVEDAAGEPVEDQADRFELRWSQPVACGDPGDPVVDASQPAIDIVWSDDDPAQPGQYVALARTDRTESGSCRYLVLDAGGGASVALLVELL